MASEANSFLARLTARATTEATVYDGLPSSAPDVGASVTTCPGCGAGRAKQDGLTRCAYCGHEFMNQTLTDGIYLSAEDSSR